MCSGIFFLIAISSVRRKERSEGRKKLKKSILISFVLYTLMKMIIVKREGRRAWVGGTKRSDHQTRIVKLHTQLSARISLTFFPHGKVKQTEMAELCMWQKFCHTYKANRGERTHSRRAVIEWKSKWTLELIPKSIWLKTRLRFHLRVAKAFDIKAL